MVSFSPVCQRDAIKCGAATLARMANSNTELILLYQMGASEDWTWFSIVAVFLSEAALRAYVGDRGITLATGIMEPNSANAITLLEPNEFVAVRTREGEVPDVELAQPGDPVRASIAGKRRLDTES